MNVDVQKFGAPETEMNGCFAPGGGPAGSITETLSLTEVVEQGVLDHPSWHWPD